MVVNKKFEKNPPKEDAMEYISKGGQVRADMPIIITESQWKTICLRMPLSILETVDLKVKERAALTRTAWILEAIQQKLKSEEES